MPVRILIVEDEAPIADGLAFNLQKEGFETRIARTGEYGLEVMRRFDPNLVLLDLMLPGISGLDVCWHIRREWEVPIIMVTARDSETDRIAGLELGADDCITKPFSLVELMARVRAVLRRVSGPPPERSELLDAGGVTMDLGRPRVEVRGQDISLSPREYELLALLMRNRGRVLPRDVLLEGAWKEDALVEPRTVDVHVRWLREKIEQDPAHPQLIQTIRGVGYRFGE